MGVTFNSALDYHTFLAIVPLDCLTTRIARYQKSSIHAVQ